MRHVTFDPAALSGDARGWWDAWAADAEAATMRAIGAWERGEDPSFDSAVWGRLKEWLLAHVFYDKCAYCESKIVRFSGHAEHFRPKGRVAVKDQATGRSVLIKARDPRDAEVDHPGYFWLAYHWKNLLPSCEACNTRRGKRDQFPVTAGRSHVLLKRLTAQEARDLGARGRASVTWPEYYYLDPDELDRLEGPLLLHPYRDEPRQHLRFGEFGLVAAVEGSELGRASVVVYDLEDERLRIERQKQQERAATQFQMTLICCLARGLRQAIAQADAKLEDFQAGKEAYSAAALDYVDMLRPRG